MVNIYLIVLTFVEILLSIGGYVLRLIFSCLFLIILSYQTFIDKSTIVETNDGVRGTFVSHIPIVNN